MTNVSDIKHLLSQTTITFKAVIREAECIGCTKCIPACPVDAILGSAKHMHAVMTDHCIGCELCVAPCPVDCIDIVKIDSVEADPTENNKRYTRKQLRLEEETIEKNLAQQKKLNISRKKYIEAAIKRVQQKKGLSVRPTLCD